MDVGSAHAERAEQLRVRCEGAGAMESSTAPCGDARGISNSGCSHVGLRNLARSTPSPPHSATLIAHRSSLIAQRQRLHPTVTALGQGTRSQMPSLMQRVSRLCARLPCAVSPLRRAKHLPLRADLLHLRRLAGPTRYVHSQPSPATPPPLSSHADPPSPPDLSPSPPSPPSAGAGPVSVYFHRPSMPPSTFYIIALSSPSSSRSLSVRAVPLSPSAYSALRQSAAATPLLSHLTVDHSATGADPTKFPHPTVFLSTPTLTRERMRWPQAVDAIVEELSGLSHPPPSPAERAYATYALSWMGRWSQLSWLTPPLSEGSRGHRFGLQFDPTRICLAVVAVGATTLLAGRWQQQQPRRKPQGQAT